MKTRTKQVKMKMDFSSNCRLMIKNNNNNKKQTKQT